MEQIAYIPQYHPMDIPPQELPLLHLPNLQDLLPFIYSVGFLRGQFSDVALQVSNFPTLQVHALIIAQSPFFAHLISQQSGPPYTLKIPTDDQYITPSSVAYVCQHLYRPIPHFEEDVDLKAVLATSIFFQMDDLASRVIHHIRVERDLVSWIEFSGLSEAEDKNRYLPFSKHIQGMIMGYLSHQLPFHHPESLVETLKPLPFAVVKKVLEECSIENDMTRYQTAKKVCEARGQGESVVLSFENGGKKVEVVRRGKGKKMWKIK
ncbi:BTB/POZ domain-containing protein 2 [Neolecta irregularis DAH-3]|uniref:BTB/POZ domain-containing protein 2 n=1 Tax=Neolecta irregularis (strain DAH-3) TaxID=1198029 RepID=A0A1U7LUI2_NEOID|nr:BTB/POZ domain-containing protein 2 [Neolecta irregularis DAH-3]|eukprot:OLL26304.1 BTB/POZ domain-containing protein 2 [Neolecta irregularis DAH-3]